MKLLKDYLGLVLISGLVVALDQWSKYFIRLNLAPRERWAPWEWLEPYARIINSSNTGAAFGFFKDGALFFTVVAILVSIAIIIYYPRVPRSQTALRVALALQLGGALGNLADRLLQGGQVTDYISVGRFPVFNIADAAIFLGVVILLGSSFIEGRRSRKEAEYETPDGVEHFTAEGHEEAEPEAPGSIEHSTG